MVQLCQRMRPRQHYQRSYYNYLLPNCHFSGWCQILSFVMFYLQSQTLNIKKCSINNYSLSMDDSYKMKAIKQKYYKSSNEIDSNVLYVWDNDRNYFHQSYIKLYCFFFECKVPMYIIYNNQLLFITKNVLPILSNI